MGITKREIASELGVSKRTVANYIEKLGLGNHVSRNGNTDFLDDFAAAAIADALKNPGKPSRQPADAPAAPAPDSLVDSLAAQLEIERSRNAELMEALAAERDRATRAEAEAKKKAEQERLAREKEEAAREAQRRAVPASDSGSRFRSLLDQIAAAPRPGEPGRRTCVFDLVLAIELADGALRGQVCMLTLARRSREMRARRMRARTRAGIASRVAGAPSSLV